MRFLQVLNAPASVQFNRSAFLVYAAFFVWLYWPLRKTASPEGVLIIGGFVVCSLLGFGYSFVRARRSRWILATLGLAIPATFWGLMCLLVFSRAAWWEWPIAWAIWSAIPVSLTVSLFKDKKTCEYFAHESPNQHLQATPR